MDEVGHLRVATTTVLTAERQRELAEHRAASAARGEAPYAGITVRSPDELAWILGTEAGTSTQEGENGIRADLRKVDLSGLDLSRFDLSGVDLRGANLASTILT